MIVPPSGEHPSRDVPGVRTLPGNLPKVDGAHVGGPGVPGHNPAGAGPGGRTPGNAASKPGMRVIDTDVSGRKPGGAGFAPPPPTRFADRVAKGDFSKLAQGDTAKRVQLADQYKMAQQGDVARRMGLVKTTNITNVTNVTNITNVNVHGHGHGPMPPGGIFAPHPTYLYRGPVAPAFMHASFQSAYFGPAYYPAYCWYPRWVPWVGWCWHRHCHPMWDPRPIWCRPVTYVVAPSSWAYWSAPAWTALPAVPCGTWVDVAMAVAPEAQADLQLLAVRFVDPGHPDEKLGPRYRVWFRNNGAAAVTQPFNVRLFASLDEQLRADLPQAGVRVTAIEAGDTQSVDLRLPFDVARMAMDPQGKPLAFTTIHALVDADRELVQADRANDGVRIARAEVLPVDPAAFEVDPKSAPAGSQIVVAGEGFGPEPGKVLVHLGGIEMEGQIAGWYDLGIRLELPNLPLAGPTTAELIVLRGDGAAANPIQVTINPPAAPPVAPQQ